MTLKALFYAYVLGGITFIPLVVAGLIFFSIYTSVPVGEVDVFKKTRGRLEAEGAEAGGSTSDTEGTPTVAIETDDIPRTRKGWLTMRRTFEESAADGGYVSVVRSFLDARSKDPKRSRPKDMWYVVLKGKVLYLYEDEEMTECEVAVELGGHDVVIYPEGLPDGELFAKRNAICLKPKKRDSEIYMPSVTREMTLSGEDIDAEVEKKTTDPRRQEKEREKLLKVKQATREEALNPSTPWFIFVRSNIEMEDWYFALIHGSDHPTKTPSLAPLLPIFQPSDMNHLVSTLDEQPDVIPTRWLNALIGRIFFSYYRTHKLEAYIIDRLMKKLSKVKRPTFLADIVVTEVSVGNKAPTLSKPMLKELTKEGDASIEVQFAYKGEFRITIEATANITLGTFKSYTVKLVLAAVLKELEGNLLIKVKRPPSNRIWYAFTQTPRMVLEVEPIVSDRQITWGMITSTIESRLKEIIQESVVMPNMDDIAFFDSKKHEHRGGIWGDASRHERSVALSTESDVGDDDAVSTASAPASVDTAPVAEAANPGPGSHSAKDISTTTTAPQGARETTTASKEETSEPSVKQNRRRSWFSSVRSEGSPSKGSFSLDDEDDGSLHRGRSTESEKASISAPRSRSTPQEALDTDTGDHEVPETDDSLLGAFLRPQASRRSSSQHSTKRDHTKSISTDSSKSVPDATGSSTSMPTPTPRKVSGGTSNPSSPNSFLSTLKSRAGDKQALSNTAKEAMRKWGVNWGMRKDSNSDDAADHSSIGSAIGSRLRPDVNFGVASKARASYAEVRAAVAERKGRGGHGGVGSANNSEDGGDSLGRSSSPSMPVLIPEGSRGKARALSNPWSELAPPGQDGAGASSYPESVALSTSAHSASSSQSNRLPVGDGVSRYSSPAVSRTNTTEGDPPSKPIHVQQPQAKTMTIPGIHASHRGEIMSMGYAPPPQPPSMVPLEGKSSSLYRLFKSGAAGDQPQGQSQTSQSQSQSQAQSPQLSQQSSSSSQDNHNAGADASTEGPKDTSTSTATLAPLSPSPNTNASISLSPSSYHSPSTASPHPLHQPRVPPPLPPRSTPLTLSHPPATAEPPAAPTSTAEQTLKSIATAARLSREIAPTTTTSEPTEDEEGTGTPDHPPAAKSAGAAVANPPPPLPPRRPQVPEGQVQA